MSDRITNEHNTTLRFAGEQDRAALRLVWQESFPEDPPAAAEVFLNALFCPVECAHTQGAAMLPNCLVYEEKGRPVSMTFLLPATLQTPQGDWKLQYIYAAATLPSCRGRGYFRAVLERALQVARERGEAASFLRPGEPGLVAYYARFGYRPFFECHTRRLTRAQLLELAGEAMTDMKSLPPDVPPAHYAALRDRALRSCPVHVRWDARAAAFAAESARAAGGAVLTDGRGGCALCEPVGDETLLIREWLPAEETTLYAVLAKRFVCAAYELREPAVSGGNGAFGLWLPLIPELRDAAPSFSGTQPYMGLVLD